VGLILLGAVEHAMLVLRRAMRLAREHADGR
jgi:hypothetical protein